MKRKLRIVFMGTPQFAVGSLEVLIKENYNIVGVITAPDRPSGRGRKLQQSDVKKFAVEHNLKVLQPTNLKDSEFIEELKTLQANLQVVVAFRMLPRVVWQMPELGTFNLHASLLPNYRGAAPIHWAIINGETQTGVTTFYIDDKIDTGEIILKAKTNIANDETVGELHDKLMLLGSKLVLDTVKLIEDNKVVTKSQIEHSELRQANKLNKDNTRIDWSLDVHTIYNKIRGLNPFPAAWSKMQNGDETLNIKIFRIRKTETDHNRPTGMLKTDNGTLKVAVKNGYIFIDEIQLPGKRKMDVRSLLNGYEILDGAKVL